VLLAAWAAARFATGDIAEGLSACLDERGLVIRYRVVRTGYHAVWSTGLVVAIVLIVFEDIPVPAGRSGSLLLSAIVAAAAVPTMLLCRAAPRIRAFSHTSWCSYTGSALCASTSRCVRAFELGAEALADLPQLGGSPITSIRSMDTTVVTTKRLVKLDDIAARSTRGAARRA
jgi:hypothetical protein